MSTSRRSRARELAMQMLYQADLNPDAKADTIRSMIAEELREPGLQEFAWSLFSGVMEWKAQIDRHLEETAANWQLSRMAPTDRNILRLGAYELLHTDTPHRVVIDEAVEMAKKFGSMQSFQFVNGILDRLVPDEKRSKPATPTND
ncbi:MAG: transcription antitermination factor NusB [Planctomycetaceae bacterium]